MPTIYEWPHGWYGFISSTFRLQARSQVTPRTWIGGKSVYGPHAQLWVAQVALPRQRWNENGQAIAAFFSRLDGQAGLLRIGHYQRLKPQLNRAIAAGSDTWNDGTFFNDGTGFASGNVPDLCTIAADATRGADTVSITGLQASASRVLRRGDLFEIQPGGVASDSPNLYEVQADAATDSGGSTTVEIRPRLRQDIASGDGVLFSYPTSVFRCVDDDQGVAETDHPNLASIGFSLVEAII
jgi:hypothetical protein